MASRSSRYYENDTSEKPLRSTRMGRNKHLYDEINSKIGYEDISSLDTQTRIDLSALTGTKTSREDYQKIKDYKEFVSIDNEEEKPIITSKETIKETKLFDINSIIEKAKQNRLEKDELESKRKPKEEDLSSIDRIKDEDVTYKKDFDEEELKDLINTITSHELKGDIEEANQKGLLDDLIATNVDLRVTEGIAEESITEANKLKLENTINPNTATGPIIDNSFYTKSMDLSDQDFELSDEVEMENQKTRKRLLVVIIIVLVIGLLVGGYFTLKKMGVI